LATLPPQLIGGGSLSPWIITQGGLLRYSPFASSTFVQSTNFVRLLLVIRETERDSDNSVNQRAAFDSDWSWSETSNWFWKHAALHHFAIGQRAIFQLKGSR
jgi:hypothetical protein